MADWREECVTLSVLQQLGYAPANGFGRFAEPRRVPEYSGAHVDALRPQGPSLGVVDPLKFDWDPLARGISVKEPGSIEFDQIAAQDQQPTAEKNLRVAPIFNQNYRDWDRSKQSGEAVLESETFRPRDLHGGDRHRPHRR